VTMDLGRGRRKNFFQNRANNMAKPLGCKIWDELIYGAGFSDTSG
jgi:hypothetical protein